MGRRRRWQTRLTSAPSRFQRPALINILCSGQSEVAKKHTARECEGMPDTEELRKRAAWYREIAESAGNPTIWAMRLHTAEKLEAEADHLEYLNSSPSGTRQARK